MVWSLLFLNGQEQLEFRRQLFLAVQPVREVDPPDTAIGMNGHPQGFNVVRPIGPPCEIRQIELDLIPT